RCEDMVDVRRLKMLQMVQLFKCEEDASQAVEWLGELLDALLKTHIRLGDDSQETKVLLEKHRKFVDVAQSTYDYGRQLLQATVVLCQSLRCTTRSSGDTLPRLNRVWKQFTVTADERQHRLDMASTFHTAAERVLKEGSGQVELLDVEVFEEVETVGKALLDRLTVPVIFPDGRKTLSGARLLPFGSPSSSAREPVFLRSRARLPPFGSPSSSAREPVFLRSGARLPPLGSPSSSAREPVFLRSGARLPPIGSPSSSDREPVFLRSGARLPPLGGPSSSGWHRVRAQPTNASSCRSEQFFGSPGDMASSAENIRDKMKVVEDKRLQQEEAEQLQEEAALEAAPDES
ncbi:hypothetical protein NFI96_017516, partial [Prochilodus magdalenae]